MPIRPTSVLLAAGITVLAGCGAPAGSADIQERSEGSAGSANPTVASSEPAAGTTPAGTAAPSNPPVSPPSPATPTAPATPATPAVPLGTRNPSVHVTIAVPQYDAPGAPVQVIVTAAGAKDVDVAVDGNAGQCVGDMWTHRTGTSRRCWITLPTTPGTHTITARARLGDRYGVGTKKIEAKGPNGGAVDAATRDRILTCGNTTRDVWLTFDDGFLEESTMRTMLTALRRENVQARFFAMGQWARANPRMVAAIRSEGHLIENHTDTHESLNEVDAATLRSQIERGPSSDATLLRPGFGAGAFTRRVTDEAARVGQDVCYWDVDTRDWSRPGVDAIIDRALRGDSYTPPAHPGSVILMHMTNPQTARALPGLIRSLRAEGLTLPPLH